MSIKSEKPYVLRAAEFVYSNIIEIKKQNLEMNNIQAFEIFMTTKEYDILSSGESVSYTHLRAHETLR